MGKKMNENIYEKIYSFDNLYNAFKKVSSCNKFKSSSLKFYSHLEENLISIQNDLLFETYEIGEFFNFVCYEPKRREISALPYRDRVVQAALCNVIEPDITKRFINDSYSCIKNKGALKAANRLSYFANKPTNIYYFKCDISKYFYNVNLDITFNLYKRYIQDEKTLNLIYKILYKDNPKNGIKIGNRLSQLTANIYLNELDRFIKHTLKIKYYVRYMDDFIILDMNKNKLEKILSKIKIFLEQELKLQFNNKTKIGKISQGIEFVGYIIFSGRKIIKKQTTYRFRRFVTAFINGKISPERFCKSITSMCGHAVHTSNYLFYIKQLMRVIRHLLKIQE